MAGFKEKAKYACGWGRTVVKGFLGNNCAMHAAGLTYFAMLALVPSLCLLLFAAKMCGIDDYARRAINTHIDRMIENVEKGQDDDVVHTLADVNVLSEEELEKKRIAALEFGSQARTISNDIFDRIDRFDIGTLGWVGFVFLLWTCANIIPRSKEVYSRYTQFFGEEFTSLKRYKIFPWIY